MLKSSAGRIGRKKTSRPFKEFHAEWIESLRSSLLPLLRHSISSSASSTRSQELVSHIGGAMVASSDLLSTHVSTVHSHFQAYYHALDLASRHDVSQILAPQWRSPLEKPFLFFGDFHPSLFTNLLRSLNPSQTPLISKIEHIERGIRLILPSIVQRFRDAHARFTERISQEWTASRGKEELKEEGVRAHMEELETVFGDINRLRRSVLGDIIAAADAYQAALFLEALADFVVGFWDQDLIQEFEQCRSSIFLS